MISDIHGVSGTQMLRAIAAGERSPSVLAEMARGVMRRKLAALWEALICRLQLVALVVIASAATIQPPVPRRHSWRRRSSACGSGSNHGAGFGAAGSR